MSGPAVFRRGRCDYCARPAVVSFSRTYRYAGQGSHRGARIDYRACADHRESIAFLSLRRLYPDAALMTAPDALDAARESCAAAGFPGIARVQPDRAPALDCGHDEGGTDPASCARCLDDDRRIDDAVSEHVAALDEAEADAGVRASMREEDAEALYLEKLAGEAEDEREARS